MASAAETRPPPVETSDSNSTSTSKSPPITKRVVAASFLFRYRPSSSSLALPRESGSGASHDEHAAASSDGTEVALFRRSDKVRTYQHKLAPVSGSMDPQEDNGDPRRTAIREIKEETGLDAGTDIELLLAGKPYSFTDESIGRQWTIHPFSWRLRDRGEGTGGDDDYGISAKGEQGITIDWEHSGWEWHDPCAVSDADEFGGVPRLLDSLRRVWPAIELGQTAAGFLLEGLGELRDDHENGARQLATRAVCILRNVVEHIDIEGTLDKSGSDDKNEKDIMTEWWRRLRMAAWHICNNGRPSMSSAITSAVLTSLDRIYSDVVLTLLQSNPAGNKDSGDSKVRHTLEILDKQIAERSGTTARIQKNLEAYITQILQAKDDNHDRNDSGNKTRTLSILTLSLSSTITSCLLGAALNLGVGLDMRILESRPRFEGVTCAAKLLLDGSSGGGGDGGGGEGDNEDDQVRITMYSDASASHASRGADMVLLGADRISASGDVSNKTGSLPAVLCAKEVDSAGTVKVVVLSETDKVAAQGGVDEHVVEDNDPREMSGAWALSAGSGAGAVSGADAVLAEAYGKNKKNTIDGRRTASRVEIKNIYFEWVPARLVDVYITERGRWSREDIEKRSAWIGEEETKFFGDL